MSWVSSTGVSVPSVAAHVPLAASIAEADRVKLMTAVVSPLRLLIMMTMELGRTDSDGMGGEEWLGVGMVTVLGDPLGTCVPNTVQVIAVRMPCRVRPHYLWL